MLIAYTIHTPLVSIIDMYCLTTLESIQGDTIEDVASHHYMCLQCSCQLNSPCRSITIPITATGTSPLQLSNLKEGDHRVKVMPVGCGRNRRARIFDFTVQPSCSQESLSCVPLNPNQPQPA